MAGMAELYGQHEQFLNTLPDRFDDWPTPPDQLRRVIGDQQVPLSDDQPIIDEIRLAIPLEDVELIHDGQGRRWFKLILQTYGNEVENSLVQTPTGLTDKTFRIEIDSLPLCQEIREEEVVASFSPPFQCQINDQWIATRRTG